jgi:hypothetical protein
MTPEGRIKARVKVILNHFDEAVYRNWPVPAGYGESMLDCVGCHRGQFFMVETKAPGKTPTPRQQETARRVRAAGGIVFEIDDEAGVQELWRWLNRP